MCQVLLATLAHTALAWLGWRILHLESCRWSVQNLHIRLSALHIAYCNGYNTRSTTLIGKSQCEHLRIYNIFRIPKRIPSHGMQVWTWFLEVPSKRLPHPRLDCPHFHWGQPRSKIGPTPFGDITINKHAAQINTGITSKRVMRCSDGSCSSRRVMEAAKR